MNLERNLSNIEHRNDIVSLLSKYKLNINICEVGVFTGDYAKILLESNPSKFYCIDVFEEEECDKVLDGRQKYYLQFNKFSYKHFKDRFKDYESINTIKGFSFDVVDNFEDDFFDFVYIDADHTYESVKKDINDWYKKVKPGGILGGHDYFKHIGKTFDGEKFEFGIIKAINEFSKLNSIKFYVTKERVGSWFLIK